MAEIKTNKDYYKPTEWFVPSQPNPTEKIGHGKKADCVIRAFAHVMSVTWIEAYIALCKIGEQIYSVPNDPLTIQAYCERKGYKRETYKAVKGQKRMTAEQFAQAHPKGKYIVNIANHTTACINGKIYDSWNCGNSIVYSSYEIK